MAETNNKPTPVVDEDQVQKETLSERFMDWVRTELVWYAGSFSLHLLGLSLLLLLPNFGGGDNQEGTLTIVSKAEEEVVNRAPDTFDPLDIDKFAGIEPSELKVDPTPRPPGREETHKETYYDASPVFEEKGGGTRAGSREAVGDGSGASAFGLGSKLPGVGGIGMGWGTGTNSGSGGNGTGFGGPGRGHIKPGDGGTPHSQYAVNAALAWLAKHQLYEGNWSLQHYVDRCTDKTCTGTGDVLADAGATAMGLLPFLAAGQTHKSPGPYKEHIRKGLAWLIRHQQPDGNLAKGAVQMMYSHGLATIALAEAYGMTGDREVGVAAQGAVNFILNAQNTADGGWRYNPKDPGDTSVFGWQVMALKSAHMAGLNVGGSVFSGSSKWLDSVAVHDGVEYAYQPGQGPSPTMTSVGLLCRQYLGAKRADPMLTGGMDYLSHHLPDEGFPNVYYWYYATQVMHNMSGSEWDAWNRKMRELLVHTQVRDTDECANGSWAPQKDAWGRQGGRLMQTSLSCLTLEIYYRYLPLFKDEAGGGAVAATHGTAEKPGKKAAAK